MGVLGKGIVLGEEIGDKGEGKTDMSHSVSCTVGAGTTQRPTAGGSADSPMRTSAGLAS